MLVCITRVLIVLLALVALAYAQDDRATISGTVVDSSGATVPRAVIKATRVDTNEVKEVRSTSDGHYSIPYLILGLYNIEVTASGFQTLKRHILASKERLRPSNGCNSAVTSCQPIVRERANQRGNGAIPQVNDMLRGIVRAWTAFGERCCA